MAKAYCKYPAIVGIVIASLIVISLIWCCVRCCCCGLNCCCGCFSCFNRCCPSGRNRDWKRGKHTDSQPDYPQPNPYAGYIPPQGMPVNPAPYQGPNTATFVAPAREGNGDRLPSMPTLADGKLQDANSRGDVEMGSVNQSTPVATHAGLGAAMGGRVARGGYQELAKQDDGHGQPGTYRNTRLTHPYGSDLGAQGLAASNNPYDTGPSSNSNSLQRPSYRAYSPAVGQAGNNAGSGSYREI
jgi:hypothetical protein